MRVLLEREGNYCDLFVECDKVKFKNRTECHVFEEFGSLSDDSLIYTHDDTFCNLKKIVLLNADGQNECVGLFADVLDVGDCIGFAHHIVQVTNKVGDHRFILASTVRCIGPRINIHENLFVTPVANHLEMG